MKTFYVRNSTPLSENDKKEIIQILTINKSINCLNVSEIGYNEKNNGLELNGSFEVIEEGIKKIYNKYYLIDFDVLFFDFEHLFQKYFETK